LCGAPNSKGLTELYAKAKYTPASDLFWGVS
jgi:hypothetical protein